MLASLDPANPPSLSTLVSNMESLSRKQTPMARVVTVKTFEFIMEHYPSHQFNLIELSLVAISYVAMGGQSERGEALHMLFAAIDRSGPTLEWNRLTRAAATLVDRLCVAIESSNRWEYTEALLALLDKLHPSSIMMHAAMIYAVLSRSPPDGFDAFEQKLINGNVFNDKFFNAFFYFPFNRAKRQTWTRLREYIQDAITQGTGEYTQGIFLNVLEEAFRHKRFDIADDVLQMTRDIDYVDGRVYGRIAQIYIHSDLTKRAVAVYHELKEKDVAVDASMFTDCATFTARSDPFSSRALEFIQSIGEEIQPTAYSVALTARHLTLHRQVMESIEQFHTLLSDEYWNDVTFEVMLLALETLESLGIQAVASGSLDSSVQMELKKMIPDLVDDFLAKKFQNLPFIFNGGHIQLTPRAVNSIMLLIEIVGPRKSVISALDTCIMVDKYPALSMDSARMLLTYLGALNLLPSNAWDTFREKHRINESTMRSNISLKGSARRELREIYGLCAPGLAKMLSLIHI